MKKSVFQGRSNSQHSLASLTRCLCAVVRWKQRGDIKNHLRRAGLSTRLYFKYTQGLLFQAVRLELGKEVIVGAALTPYTQLRQTCKLEEQMTGRGIIDKVQLPSIDKAYEVIQSRSYVSEP